MVEGIRLSFDLESGNECVSGRERKWQGELPNTAQICSFLTHLIETLLGLLSHPSSFPHGLRHQRSVVRDAHGSIALNRGSKSRLDLLGRWLEFSVLCQGRSYRWRCLGRSLRRRSKGRRRRRRSGHRGKVDYRLRVQGIGRRRGCRWSHRWWILSWSSRER